MSSDKDNAHAKNGDIEDKIKTLENRLHLEQILNSLSNTVKDGQSKFIEKQKNSIEQLNEQISQLTQENAHLRNALKNAQHRPSTTQSNGFGWAAKKKNPQSEPASQIAAIQKQMNEDEKQFYRDSLASQKDAQEQILDAGEKRIARNKEASDRRHKNYMLNQEYMQFISDTGFTHVSYDTWLLFRNLPYHKW